MEHLTVFLGWATLIHFFVLTVMTACLILFRRWMISIHGWMFKIEGKDLQLTYFQFLA